MTEGSGLLADISDLAVEVLVIDDDPGMAETVVEILAGRGIAAVAVTSASAAIAKERELRPAAVVCDQRLPDISGLDLCSAIRAIDPDISLILLTGHASLDTAIAAVGQIDQYLTKPAPPEELVKAVVAGIDRSRARRAERREAEQATSRLSAIIEGTDDAVIAVTLDGMITAWNRGAEHLYGYRSDEAIGQMATILAPPDHQNDLAEMLQNIRVGRRAEHVETVQVRRDASVVQVSLTVSPIHDADGQVVGASSIARDITDRIAADELRQQLESSAARHAQALQINDSIVQHLVVSQARLGVGDAAGGADALTEALTRARGLIDDLLPDHVLTPEPSSGPTTPTPTRRGDCSVVIADDSPDVRSLVRMLLEVEDGFQVVAEAADGHEAIAEAASHQPDLVLLDHAMPNLDGLSALAEIKQAAPKATVVMLSGFSAERLEESALAAGASAYITKSDLASRMVPEIERIMGMNIADAAS